MTKKILSHSFHWDDFSLDQTTTNVYADIISVDTRELEDVTIMIYEDGTNDIEYQVEGSMGGGIWTVLVATQDVAAGATAIEDNLFLNYGMFRYMRVRIRADVGGAQGVVSCWTHGIRMGG